MNKVIPKKNTQIPKVPFDVLIGRAAMLGFVLTCGAYLTIDAIAPGFI